MNERDLIKKVVVSLGAADRALNDNNHTVYAEQMQCCLDLLIEELIGNAPIQAATPPGTFNPEKILTEIALAVKYRTISTNHRWYIIYYHTRITCVTTNMDVPNKIILHEFSEKMANVGFSQIYWNQLKQNVIKLYKELET